MPFFYPRSVTRVCRRGRIIFILLLFFAVFYSRREIVFLSGRKSLYIHVDHPSPQQHNSTDIPTDFPPSLRAIKTYRRI